MDSLPCTFGWIALVSSTTVFRRDSVLLLRLCCWVWSRSQALWPVDGCLTRPAVGELQWQNLARELHPGATRSPLGTNPPQGGPTPRLAHGCRRPEHRVQRTPQYRLLPLQEYVAMDRRRSDKTVFLVLVLFFEIKSVQSCVWKWAETFSTVLTVNSSMVSVVSYLQWSIFFGVGVGGRGQVGEGPCHWFTGYTCCSLLMSWCSRNVLGGGGVKACCLQASMWGERC